MRRRYRVRHVITNNRVRNDDLFDPAKRWGQVPETNDAVEFDREAGHDHLRSVSYRLAPDPRLRGEPMRDCHFESLRAAPPAGLRPRRPTADNDDGAPRKAAPRVDH